MYTCAVCGGCCTSSVCGFQANFTSIPDDLGRDGFHYLTFLSGDYTQTSPGSCYFAGPTQALPSETIDNGDGSTSTVYHRLGKPQYTIEESRRAHPLAIHMSDSGGGMGDTVVGLYAACGLADLVSRPVVYHAKWSDWIARASHPNLIIRPHRADIGLDASGGWEGEWGYNNATKSAPSRLWAYCANIAAGFGLPTVTPARPTIDTAVHEPTAAGRYAVIAPYSSQWPAREWPSPKFTELAAALVDGGFEVIAVGSPNQIDRMAATFGPVIGASWRCGFAPAHVADLVLGAAVVIGNDSGIVHLGGLLGVPT